MRKKADACEYCRTVLDAAERLITVYRHRHGKHFIFERVPARVCPGCGERYFAAAVAREMDRQLAARRRRATIAVPVIALRAAG